MSTIILQSQHPGRLHGWQGRCCDSVAAWAARSGFAYVRCGDELFDRVPDALRRRHAAQPVVLADLARLLWLAEQLEAGHERAIWCDADLLVFRHFTPSHRGDAFGRESWVQSGDRGLRRYRKIHNAWLQFERGSSVLPFYIDRATRLLELAESPMVPQFIGPKLLSAWHNLVPFAVEEQVGMLSPLAAADLLSGAHDALDLLRQGHKRTLCALNLCASLESRAADGVCLEELDYQRLVDGLLKGDFAARL